MLNFDMEIMLTIPVDELIQYPSDYDDNYFENQSFKEIREFLDINIDVLEIMDTIGYNEGKRENPSISVYYSRDSFNEYILLDTYIGKTDQLDLIYVGFRCRREKATELRNLVRTFYDQSSKYNIYYCEGTNGITEEYKTDFSDYKNLNKNRDEKIVLGNGYKFYKY